MPLKTKHFFPFIKLIRALDIKNEFKAIYEKAKGKSMDELDQLDKTGEGLDYLFILIDKLPQAEKEVFQFLSVYTDKTKQELDEMELDEIVQILQEVLSDENFQSFFQQAMK